MSRNVFGGAVLALGLTTALAAQNPPAQPPTQTPPAGQQESMAQAKTVTLEGCLVREKDVPGRTPNPAERAGVMEDYILTDAKVKDPYSASPTPPASAGQPTGTSGTAARKFEVRGLDDERLQQFVGQRVEIVGRIDPKDLDERAREAASPAGEPAGDLPEIHATTIKKSESPGSCPQAK
jgi:hypothetical protein